MTIAISRLSPQTIPDITGVPARALGPAESALLAGRSAALVVNASGTYELSLNQRPVIRAFALAEEAIAAEQNPVFIQRTFQSGIRERAFVPLRHTAAAWHWSAATPTDICIRWEWESHAGGIALLCDRDVDWQTDDSSAQLKTQLDAGEGLTLLIVDPAGEAGAKALRALENVAALVRSRVADWNRAQQERVHVSGSAAEWAAIANAAVYALHASGIDFATLRAGNVGVAPGLQSAAQTVRELLDLLGFAPDPEKHRIVLAPKLPAEWTNLELRNLPLGNADTISLRYDRTGAVHTFVLTQETGAFPPRLIFEPAIPAQNVSVITVDGVRADLDLRRSGERTICPVQLVLDRPRTIVVVSD